MLTIQNQPKQENILKKHFKNKNKNISNKRNNKKNGYGNSGYE